MSPNRGNWCRLGIIRIRAPQLEDYGKIMEHTSFRLKWHQWLLICAAIVWLEGRLQAGASCLYNVITELLIWTEFSFCFLSRLNGQFDPVMSNWCLIGHYYTQTHSHRSTHTHTVSPPPAQICPDINFTDKCAAIGKKWMLPKADLWLLKKKF